MAKITAAQLADCFKQCLSNGMGYVWGLNGELYTKTMAEQRKTAGFPVPSGRSKDTYFTGDCAKWYGVRCADCSGGIVYAMRQYDPKYADRTADTFKKQFNESGPIASLPEIPGLALWRSGHIGIYIGGGECVEFRGTAYGCVKTKVKDRDFTTWGKLADVDYTSTVEPSEPAKPPVVTPQVPFYAVCSGGSVNVRTLPNSADNNVIFVAHEGDRLLSLPETNGWHEVAAYDGKKLVTGFMSAKYVKEV